MINSLWKRVHQWVLLHEFGGEETLGAHDLGGIVVYGEFVILDLKCRLRASQRCRRVKYKHCR
jgi:hypothetical protein